MASGARQDDDEICVEVGAAEARQWSDELSAQLETIGAEVGTDAPRYRATFLCAYLLQCFADSLDEDEGGQELN